VEARGGGLAGASGGLVVVQVQVQVQVQVGAGGFSFWNAGQGTGCMGGQIVDSGSTIEHHR